MSENRLVAQTYTLSEEALRLNAWLGDAVLGLFMRKKIALDQKKINTPVFIEVTSNQFLSSMGSPTRVEAQIGMIYSNQGIEAAESFIETEIWPRAEKRIAKISSKS
ncbi:MAG: hypothetical protein AAF212_10590 [Verrucomicrobiota bacterium]